MGLMDSLSGLIGGIASLDPLNAAVDLVGDALGLSSQVKAAAKMGIGAFTGDAALLLKGVAEEGTAVSKQGDCSRVELPPPFGAPPAGYPAPPPVQSPGASTFVPVGPEEVLDLRQTRTGNRLDSLFDPFGGFREIDACTLESRLRNNPQFRAEWERDNGCKVILDAQKNIDGKILIQRGRYETSADPSIPPAAFGANRAIPSGKAQSQAEAPASGQGSSELGDILDDPSMSIEEKVEDLLTRIMDKAGQEELEAAKELEAAGTDSSKASKAQMKLQKAMEKKKQMFDLISNLSQVANQMANTAIHNLARA